MPNKQEVKEALVDEVCRASVHRCHEVVSRADADFVVGYVLEKYVNEGLDEFDGGEHAHFPEPGP